MQRSIKILVVCLSLIVCLIAGQQTVMAETDDYNWINTIYFMDDNYELVNYSLNLPDYQTKSFSPRAQEDLLNFASQFEGNSQTGLEAEYEQMEEMFTINDIKQKEEEENYLQYEPSPEVKVKADYSQDKEDLKIETNTNIDLEYYMNQKTLIRAGYSLVSKEWPDIREIEGSGSKSDSDKENNNGDNDEDNSNVDDSTDNHDSRPVLIYSNQESVQEGRVGISYQTTDKITISADYIREDLFSDDAGFSTIFGVEYTDEIGKLRAKYLIDSGESKETMTGLELDLKDLATLSASYKILDPEMIEEQLNKESVWDFGIDFNLSDLSSVSIGYQLIDSKNGNTNNIDTISDKESNIEASFEIKF